MSELVELLVSAVRNTGRDRGVGLLLSGGLDSLSVGLALAEAGRKITAYTYELEGHVSQDRPKAERIAKHFRWPLRVVTVPSKTVRDDFLRLAIEHGCRKKVQFEVTHPLLHLFPLIEENEVWSGFNADDYYGNTKQCVMEQDRLKKSGASASKRKEAFNRWRASAYRKTITSASTWWHAQKVASLNGKRLLDPYLDDAVRDFFQRYHHDQLASPKKPLIRVALRERLDGLPKDSIAVGVRLQIGGGINALFETLLSDPTINRFHPPYKTVSALCQRWARDVTSNTTGWHALLNQPHSQADRARIAERRLYAPYTMERVRATSAERRFNVISTFAGGGGSSVGYSLAGGQVKLAIEFVPEAVRAYRSNFPACEVLCQDIRQISDDRRRTVALLRSIGLKPGDVDVLDGSPPCSEFSVAGRGLSDQTRSKAYSDVKQAGIAMLPFDLVDLIEKVRPKIVVIENVPGITHRGKQHVLNNLLHALRHPRAPLNGRRGYFAGYRILSAADYGAPQKRRRLFIIGVRCDVGEATGIDNDDKVSLLFPSANSGEITIREALAGLRQAESDITPWQKACMPFSIGRLIRMLPKNPAKHIGLAHVDPAYRNGSNFSLVRSAWDLPAPTLTVMGQGPNALGGVLHPNEDRKFTLPELKRLTGLPDDYVLTGTLAQAAERVCRMVPPLMIKAIAESVYQRVLLPYREINDAAA